MAGLWGRLSRALRRLEAIAADPARLDADALEVLPVLQYELHWSSELLAGVEPPPGTEVAHQELEAALVDARDATGEMVEAIACGGEGAVRGLLHEWRGALFRVRLARLRLSTVQPAPLPVAPEEFPRGAAAATALTLAGTTAFTAGAVFGLWVVWAAGLALVALGFLAYRPA